MSRGDRTLTRQEFALALLLIAAVGLAVRIAFVAFSSVPHLLPLGLGDPAFYHRGANLLADGKGFIEPFLDTTAPSASHPPLYIAWLAIPSYFFPGHDAGPTVHMVWSCVLGTGTIVVCGFAGREIAGARTGLIAAGLAALYPNLWVHDGQLHAETAALFTAAVVILLTYRFLHRPSGRRAIWLGLWCGLAGLARPELVLALPLLLAPIVLSRRNVGWVVRVRWLAGGTAATVLVLAPWIVYNLDRFEEPVYMSTNFGSTLVAANCDETYYGSDIGFKSYACAARLVARERAENPHWERLDESQRDGILRERANEYIEDHRARLPVVVAARWGRTIGVYQPFKEVQFNHDLFRQPIWLGYLLVLSFYVVAALAIVGLVVMRRRRVQIWPLLAIPVIVLISIATTFSQIRYRAPAEVALVLAAAVALDAGYIRWRSSREQEPDLHLDDPAPEDQPLTAPDTIVPR